MAINRNQTLEEYLIEARLDCMEAVLQPSPDGFQVLLKATQQVIGTGATKEAALDQAALQLSERDLFCDTHSIPLDDLDRECRMPLDEWLSCVDSGGFIDYDGSGHPATLTHRGSAILSPSYATAKRPLPTWVTHVCWYNK